MGDIWPYGAVHIAELIRQHTVSSIEVVEAFLRRIEAVNPTINAVVVLAGDRALHEARAADTSLARGQARGPLHGVPFTGKDVFDTAGVETSVGIPERVGVVPAEESVAVARMRRAAILLGKTNVPPGGAGGVTDNAVHGRTNNPYSRERSPAGSSGGEAAIQAAGGSPVGLGSDSGGSLRVPAHFCGVAALKPTTGRVPNTGAFQQPGGLSDARTQIGPLSRYVEDLAPVLAIVAGPDGRDSGVVPMPVGDPDRRGAAGIARRVLHGRRIHADNAGYGRRGPRRSGCAGGIRRESDRGLPRTHRSGRARHLAPLLGTGRAARRGVRPAARRLG
jgi:amidase